MASYTTMFSSGQVHNQIKEFVVDTKDQIDAIDISQILPGSRTFVIKDSQWYMLDNQFKWQPVDWNSGGGGSADHVIYDGGDIDNPDGQDEEVDHVIYDGQEET